MSSGPIRNLSKERAPYQSPFGECFWLQKGNECRISVFLHGAKVKMVTIVIYSMIAIASENIRTASRVRLQYLHDRVGLKTYKIYKILLPSSTTQLPSHWRLCVLLLLNLERKIRYLYLSHAIESWPRLIEAIRSQGSEWSLQFKILLLLWY